MTEKKEKKKEPVGPGLAWLCLLSLIQKMPSLDSLCYNISYKWSHSHNTYRDPGGEPSSHTNANSSLLREHKASIDLSPISPVAFFWRTVSGLNLAFWLQSAHSELDELLKIHLTTGLGFIPPAVPFEIVQYKSLCSDPGRLFSTCTCTCRLFLKVLIVLKHA